MLGRLPTVEEYMTSYTELGKDKARVYKYLNFDQVESYVEAAKDA